MAADRTQQVRVARWSWQAVLALTKHCGAGLPGRVTCGPSWGLGNRRMFSDSWGSLREAHQPLPAAGEVESAFKHLPSRGRRRDAEEQARGRGRGDPQQPQSGQSPYLCPAPVSNSQRAVPAQRPAHRLHRQGEGTGLQGRLLHR